MDQNAVANCATGLNMAALTLLQKQPLTRGKAVPKVMLLHADPTAALLTAYRGHVTFTYRLLTQVPLHFLQQHLEGAAYRLVKEVGCICFTLNTGDEGCFGTSKGGPVQALEPGMQLDFSSPTVAKAVTGVQLQQPVHQVLALGRDVLILWPGQLPVQNTAEDFLAGVQILRQLDKHAARKPPCQQQCNDSCQLWTGPAGYAVINALHRHKPLHSVKQLQTHMHNSSHCACQTDYV